MEAENSTGVGAHTTLADSGSEVGASMVSRGLHTSMANHIASIASPAVATANITPAGVFAVSVPSALYMNSSVPACDAASANGIRPMTASCRQPTSTGMPLWVPFVNGAAIVVPMLLLYRLLRTPL